MVELGPSTLRGRSADVYIKFYGRDQNDTPRSDTKCRRFAGRAHLVKEGGAWRYEPSGNQYDVTTIDGSLGVCNG